MASPSLTPQGNAPHAGDADSHWRAKVGVYAWMVGAAFILRFAYILAFHTYQFIPTANHYSFGFETGSIAGALARGEGFSSPFGVATGPTTWIGPVYPLICAVIFKLFGLFTTASAIVIFGFNSLCAALTCVPIVEVSKRTIGRGAAIWAGWAWAVVPLLFQWPVTWVWDMALSALLLALAFLFALQLGESRQPTSRAWIGMGAFWGFALLTNPGLLTFLPFSLAWPFFQQKAQPLRRRLRLIAMSVLALVIMVAPWMVRNSLLYHRLTFIRGNFGFELHMGNFPYSNGVGWGGYHPTVNPRELEKYKKLGEAAYIRENQGIAVKFIREHPAEFLQLTGQRFIDFWDGKAIEYNPFNTHWFIHWLQLPWPRYIHFSLSLLALWGLLLALGSRIKAAWLFASLIFYPTAYYLTYTGPRYRHAVEPEMVILSVYLLYELAGAMRKRFGRQGEPLHSDFSLRSKQINSDTRAN